MESPKEDVKERVVVSTLDTRGTIVNSPIRKNTPSCTSESRAQTSTSPGFIRNYFSASRLHHLSSWKADLADYTIRSLHTNENGKLSTDTNERRIHRTSSISEPFRTILHVDMDCFFASVAIRDRPHLRGHSVAVAHSVGGVALDFSTSEIASCNYEARACGVRNGMFIGAAKKLVPDLQIVAYEFEKYDACTKSLYSVLFQRADFVQSVSCDEVYADVTFQVQAALRDRGTESSDNELLFARRHVAMRIAQDIKQEIHSLTGGCNASIGIAGNMLLARLATSKAKPNGIFFVGDGQETYDLLRDLQLRDLPGVGGTLSQKCETALQLHTCSDIQRAGLGELQQALGERTGATLYAFAHGRDERVLENKKRQSVGSDINWGVRFTTDEQVLKFLREFCEEVCTRLSAISATAKHVTVNAKKRLYEGEPGNFLGCGHCQDYSKSVALNSHIAAADSLFPHVLALYRQIGLRPADVRGIGIHLKKLQFAGIDGSPSSQHQQGGRQVNIMQFMKQRSTSDTSQTSTSASSVPVPSQAVSTASVTSAISKDTHTVPQLYEFAADQNTSTCCDIVYFGGVDNIVDGCDAAPISEESLVQQDIDHMEEHLIVVVNTDEQHEESTGIAVPAASIITSAFSSKGNAAGLLVDNSRSGDTSKSRSNFSSEAIGDSSGSSSHSSFRHNSKSSNSSNSSNICGKRTAMLNWLSGGSSTDNSSIVGTEESRPTLPATASDVDWTVLNSLPDDVRREQMHMLKISYKARNTQNALTQGPRGEKRKRR